MMWRKFVSKVHQKKGDTMVEILVTILIMVLSSVGFLTVVVVASNLNHRVILDTASESMTQVETSIHSDQNGTVSVIYNETAKLDVVFHNSTDESLCRYVLTRD